VRAPEHPTACTFGGCYQTRQDRNAGTLHLGSSQGSNKPVLQKTKCKSGQFCAVIDRYLLLKILSFIILQMIWEIFAYSFTCCYSSNLLPQFVMLQYNSLNVKS